MSDEPIDTQDTAHPDLETAKTPKRHKTDVIDLSRIPRKPGVYIFKGSGERVLYVGKAIDLRARLKSYFRKSKDRKLIPSPDLDPRKAAMVGLLKGMTYTVTENEFEALVLEANLIKQYRPRFNVILRDDKNYPYLNVTLNEEWPRVEVVRRIRKDGSLYFGPYIPSSLMREALTFVRETFGVRPCRYNLTKPMRPCIQHEMGRCPAPCARKIDRRKYMKSVAEAVKFLKGESRGLIKGLEGRMLALSEDMKYEEAARIRDRITALERGWQSQRVIAPGLGDLDVIGFYHGEGDVLARVLFVRNGMVIGVRDFRLRDMARVPKSELISEFLETLYSKEIIPPAEVIARESPEDIDTLLTWLTEKRGGRVAFTRPQRGKKLHLLKMAEDNARSVFESGGGGAADGAVSDLASKLGLSEVPRTIGAFDVSTTSGSEPVGAFVLWEDGGFDKGGYRHVNIKTVPGIDDYSMMVETVLRVLDGIEPPDLIIIDGGKGHLDAALGAAEGRGVRDIVAVAKDPDRVFTACGGGPVDISDGSPSSLLLRRIRDEVHRFAVGFHRKKRAQRMLESPLVKIGGIGKRRRLALLRRFGSIEGIRKAGVDEIAAVPGMTRKAAETVKKALG